MNTTLGSPAPVLRPRVSRASVGNAARWFYPATAVLLLVLAFIGFGRFFMHGRAYPDRPIHPDIMAVVVAHAVTMSLWLVLLIIQPTLIAMRKHKLHMTLGKVGAALAVAILILGVITAIGSARTAPPDALVWGMTPRQFLAVPFISVWVFAGYVAAGIALRKKPDTHRAMMLMGTMTAMSAAVSRIDPLNNLYLGTVFDRVFGPFFLTLVLGAVLLALRCALVRKIDRPLSLGFAGIVLTALFIMYIAHTTFWDVIAATMIG